METQSGWSFQQGKWLSALDINPTERLQAAKSLLAVLHELDLVKRWGALFAITLLRMVPIGVIAFWQENTHIGIAAALGSNKEGFIAFTCEPDKL